MAFARMGVRVAAALLGVAALLSGEPASAADNPATEQFQAVAFGTDSRPVVVAADSRLELGSTGSIEIAISVTDDDAAAMPASMTLLSIEDQRRTWLRVVATDRGSKSFLYDGAALHSVPFDISRAGFYQIGLSTTGTVTRVFRNGVLQGEIEAGYGQAPALPLQIGGQADRLAPFRGAVEYLRIWNRPLTGGEYDRTFAEYGFPGDLPVLAPNVVLYSEFTDRQTSVFYTAQPTMDDITAPLNAYSGAKLGEEFVSIIPEGMAIREIRGTGFERIESLQFIVEDGSGARISLPILGATPGTAASLQTFTLQDDEQIAGYGGKTTALDIEERPAPGSISVTRYPALGGLYFVTTNGRTSPTFGQAGTSAKDLGTMEAEFLQRGITVMPDAQQMVGLRALNADRSAINDRNGAAWAAASSFVDDNHLHRGYANYEIDRRAANHTYGRVDAVVDPYENFTSALDHAGPAARNDIYTPARAAERR